MCQRQWPCVCCSSSDLSHVFKTQAAITNYPSHSSSSSSSSSESSELSENLRWWRVFNPLCSQHHALLSQTHPTLVPRVIPLIIAPFGRWVQEGNYRFGFCYNELFSPGRLQMMLRRAAVMPGSFRQAPRSLTSPEWWPSPTPPPCPF